MNLVSDSHIVNSNSKISDEKNYIPLFLDLTNKKIIIFGGGKVSERKSILLSNYTNVYIYSSSFTDKLQSYSKNKKYPNLKLCYIKDLLQLTELDFVKIINNTFLVVPATNNLDLNQKIITISKKINVLVNCVTYSDEVIFPSIIKKEKIIIGISTSGISPTLTKVIKKKIKSFINEKKLLMMLKLQKEVKEDLKKKKIIQTVSS